MMVAAGMERLLAIVRRGCGPGWTGGGLRRDPQSAAPLHAAEGPVHGAEKSSSNLACRDCLARRPARPARAPPLSARRVAGLSWGRKPGTTLPGTRSVTPVVRALLIANVVAFFLQVALPELADALVFVPALALVRPWSAVTYMFLHGDLMHLLFNMIALFFFGPRVETRIFSRQFAILYFVS